MDSEQIARILAARHATVGPLTVVAETGSTNDDAKRAALEGQVAHGAVFVAGRQSAGRGRGDHRWHSPDGNVYLSVVLRLRTAPEKLPPLSLAIGVALARVIDEALGEDRARIKWPNDVYVDDRKIAGILIEVVSKGAAGRRALVVGAGLNVAAREFPNELAGRATSLFLASNVEHDRCAVAAAAIDAITRVAARFDREGLTPFLVELARRDWLLGRSVRVGERAGIANGIDPSGRLQVSGGPPISAGEVELVG